MRPGDTLRTPRLGGALVVLLLERAVGFGDGENWRALILEDSEDPSSEGSTDLVRPLDGGWERLA